MWSCKDLNTQYQLSKLTLCKIRDYECKTILTLLELVSADQSGVSRQSCHSSKDLTLSLLMLCGQKEAHQFSIFQKYYFALTKNVQITFLYLKLAIRVHYIFCSRKEIGRHLISEHRKTDQKSRITHFCPFTTANPKSSCLHSSHISLRWKLLLCDNLWTSIKTQIVERADCVVLPICTSDTRAYFLIRARSWM